MYSQVSLVTDSVINSLCLRLETANLMYDHNVPYSSNHINSRLGAVVHAGRIHVQINCI